jgi:hypothetical protein
MSGKEMQYSKKKADVKIKELKLKFEREFIPESEYTLAVESINSQLGILGKAILELYPLEIIQPLPEDEEVKKFKGLEKPEFRGYPVSEEMLVQSFLFD